MQGKKRNPKFWNGYNKCIETKLKSEYNILNAVTGIGTAILAGDMKKGWKLMVKNGFKGNLAGFIVTAGIIQYQCHQKWDKYPACIKK
ncbi:hypothetical protein ACMGE5_09815 [Macrococcus equi]|uniref:hypothetical protein n=1 Tax=Macrococcus equi TaxID=3395462 RepID=UPI0039BEA4F3